jgi:hypothetical protein
VILITVTGFEAKQGNTVDLMEMDHCLRAVVNG